MNKVTKRLLLFFIGIPVVLGLVYVKFLYHLPLQIIIACVSVLAANELHNMISLKYPTYHKALILILTGLQSFLSYYFLLQGIRLEFCIWVFMIEILILLGISIFSKKFDGEFAKISTGILMLFYCGFLLTFLIRMTAFPNSRYWISLFLLIIFTCDSAAWLFGNLFGKNNKGIIAASPNKSIAGFIGGIICSVAVGVIFKLIFKNTVTYPWWQLIIVVLGTSICGIIGDLIESVFKRSVNIKDSGNLIPGRGGLLDSIDSILVAIPYYYAGLYFLFGLK